MEHDHSSAVKIIELYQQGAEAWDSVRAGNCIEQRWLARFLALIPEKGKILDLGCGGGDPIAGDFLKKGYSVTGIDTSAPLLEKCRTRFPEGEWHLQDMRTLALGRTFDALLAWDSFFHLTRSDQRKMFAIFRDHSHRGSALMFTSGPDNGEAIGEFLGQPLYHASLSNDEYRQWLSQYGFVVRAQVNEDPACGGRTVWLAQQQ